MNDVPTGLNPKFMDIEWDVACLAGVTLGSWCALLPLTLPS